MKKLSFKLLAVITLSFFLSFGVMAALVRMIVEYYRLDEGVTVWQYNTLTFLFLFSVIATFIVSFLLLIRHRLKYLQQMTEAVRSIAEGDLGFQVPVKGQDELAQLSGSINIMSQKLKEQFESERKLQQSKNELITNVSHDVRTPLTSIIGYLELLRNQEYHHEEQLAEYIETTYGKTIELKNLVNELFEYTRLSSPDMVLNQSMVDVSGILTQMSGEYVPIFENRNISIELSLSEGLNLFIDVEKLVRVFDQLFSNALKYSDAPSNLKISAYRDAAYVHIAFTNSAADFSERDPNILFERFYRTDTSRHSEGAGLGLAISKRIIELHNGRMHADYQHKLLTIHIELLAGD
ncbi:HAMP domain-containing protein [Bacillus lacus]|uniref:histidine kinase n=1 Tax=Metabacillus lacus TaxID=1983721 RepID=A0A7X2J0K0_9BACI|nr:HAMP domain-containing sensor histidine kinase [Metabacillus lacus]MRX73232.1 HAMP domain-containing protein [Metabacillus lacus]